ncbi:hypothetical protein NJF44_24575 [Pseudomonas guariconensis]|uniref:hypothetical protein n=1 Tax=Pseudomonas TaxID=286 RepID=UPI0020984856|nr:MULTISPECIES: hypothetical protein [Pseudomonas]MCO7643715.1 hypothetical protein [Pseudomonas sp. S 311-6]MCO7517965.1 hypothetical protein [Pseudomonas putida]MCO7568226.1 hypothetical protein [Pseudomonas mosselii]MCO7608408.1 hypothetical protein [Pseudomonas guariconensis]MCO7619893.1 hypothetical protein [Pseudomonas guariconensis]
MNRLPQYPDYVEPGEPKWRRWWLALLVLWGAQSGLLLTLWPEGQPRLELWLWSAVLPLSWGLVLSVRALVWRIGLMNRDAYRQVIQAAEQRWWRKRGRALPVDQVLLLGPVGDDPEDFQRLMVGVPTPPVMDGLDGATPRLRCPGVLTGQADRLSMLAMHLADQALALPERAERWPSLCALAWVGDAAGEAAFASTLEAAGVGLPAARFSLRTLKDLDALIDALPKACPGEADGLLCAGAVSREQAEEGEIPGEAGFVWVVSRKGSLRLHRGEYLLLEHGETARELCAQMQRYAGLSEAPADCLALDASSPLAFVEGGWTVGQHQLAEYWGALGELAPFVGMSLAAIQAEHSSEPCGWLGKDGEGRLAMGVVVSHGG